MSDTPREPSETPEDPASAPSVSGRSRYEDYDLTVPTPQAAPRRRTPTIAVAALVLAFSGLLPLITAVAFRPSGGATIALIVLGVAELAGAVLVFALHPLGRPLGIGLGCIGIVLGIVSATSAPASGLVTLALNGFVIYALASSGQAFRRG
jgi:uncharacterized membrane protein HdeD (DUF308 family)